MLNFDQFTCTKCGQNVVCIPRDYAKFERRSFVCDLCLSVIFDKTYPRNLKGTTTIFSAAGNSLGDNIIMEVLERMYKQDNPDETVIFLNDEENHAEAPTKYQATKFFINEFCRNDIPICFQGMIRYFATNDICKYAEVGIYPKLRFEPQKSVILGQPEKYIVFHFRNIEKHPTRPKPDRNVPRETAQGLVDFANDLGYAPVIVGNDDWMPIVGAFDCRNRLSLPEIAWLIQNARLYVGRDSGMVHVAAAVGTEIVAWGFSGERWYPKMPKSDFTALQKDESDLENIKQAIKWRIG